MPPGMPATRCSAAHWKQCAASPLCMPMRPRARCMRLNISNPGTGLKGAEASVKMSHICIASYAHLRMRDAQNAEQSVTPLCLPSAVQGESARFTHAHQRARTRTRHRQTRARAHTMTLIVAMPIGQDRASDQGHKTPIGAPERRCSKQSQQRRHRPPPPLHATIP